MGWPRKNDQMRLYADKQKKGAYFLLLVSNGTHPRDRLESIANVHPGANPSLCRTFITTSYLAKTWAKRVQWCELPLDWQAAFVHYMNSDPENQFDPHKVRGLWRTGEQPSYPHPAPDLIGRDLRYPQGGIAVVVGSDPSGLIIQFDGSSHTFSRGVQHVRSVLDGSYDYRAPEEGSDRWILEQNRT